MIDGERWDSPEGGSRLQVQLSAGPHHVEISKDGYKTYSTSVTIRPGDTQTLNVSLSTGGGLTGAAVTRPPVARRGEASVIVTAKCASHACACSSISICAPPSSAFEADTSP